MIETADLAILGPSVSASRLAKAGSEGQPLDPQLNPKPQGPDLTYPALLGVTF